MLEAVRLAPSSYGIQPYKILVVSNPEIRNQLKAVAYNQPQITDASHLFVFTVHDNFSTTHIDEYAENIAQTRNISLESIQAFVDTMKNIVSSRTKEELKNWNSKQAYLALGVLLETAALSGFDTCPMEGFDAEAFNKILKLDEQNLSTVVIAAVGFRTETDSYQHYKKVRKSKEDLFVHV